MLTSAEKRGVAW